MHCPSVRAPPCRVLLLIFGCGKLDQMCWDAPLLIGQEQVGRCVGLNAVITWFLFAGCHCPADPALPPHISAGPGAARAEGWAPCLPVPGDLQLIAAFQVRETLCFPAVLARAPLPGNVLPVPILSIQCQLLPPHPTPTQYA